MTVCSTYIIKHGFWHSKTCNQLHHLSCCGSSVSLSEETSLEHLAMASVPKLLLLILLCRYHSLVAHAGEGDARSRKVLDMDSIKSKAVCSQTKAVPSSSGGITIPLHHRHGPCSPVAASKKMPTLEEMLQRDRLRARYIQRKFSPRASVQQSDATVPTNLGTSLGTLQYVIQVGIGSPAVTQTMLIDSGSDVSWVHCKPCSQCHQRADALFDPSASSTYSPFPCSSRACTQLQSNGCSSSQQCQYIVRYVDGSNTTGTYGFDTLNLGSDVVQSFQFGCSNVEYTRFNDSTDGLMGLGGGAQSLISQTAGTFGEAFSYCLPPSSSSAGFLKLGAGTSSGFVETPMLRSVQIPTFYGVLLQAIMVDGKQLNISSSVFSGGMIMDSGTIITRLPPTAYSALSSAFKDGMKQYPAAPSSGGFLDTCFDFSSQRTITLPPVALVFSGGAVVDLDATRILLNNCLAFASADSDDGDTGIIGNVQQRTFEVLYDVGGGSVGFRAGAC